MKQACRLLRRQEDRPIIRQIVGHIFNLMQEHLASVRGKVILRCRRSACCISLYSEIRDQYKVAIV